MWVKPSFGHHNDSQRKYIFMERDSMKTQSKSVKQVGKEWMSLFSNYNPVPKRQIRCDVNCNYLAMTIIDFGLMSLSVQANMIFKFNSRFLWDGALLIALKTVADRNNHIDFCFWRTLTFGTCQSVLTSNTFACPQGKPNKVFCVKMR